MPSVQSWSFPRLRSGSDSARQKVARNRFHAHQISTSHRLARRLTACNARADPDELPRSANPPYLRRTVAAPYVTGTARCIRSVTLCNITRIPYLKLTTFCQSRGHRQGCQRDLERKWTVLTASNVQNWTDSPAVRPCQTPSAVRRQRSTTQRSWACRWPSSYVGACHPWITSKAHMPWTCERDPLLEQEAA